MSFGNNHGSIKDKADYVRKALADPRNKHTCHYPGCEAIIKPAYWGCPMHWFSLPAWARSMIWATYNPMQEMKKTPSKNYLDVVERVHIWIIATETWNTLRPMVVGENYKNLGVVHHPL
jgi:hypothetical protein